MEIMEVAFGNGIYHRRFLFRFPALLGFFAFLKLERNMWSVRLAMRSRARAKQYGDREGDTPPGRTAGSPGPHPALTV